MREYIIATAIFMSLANAGHSEAWSVQQPDGSWVNTEHHPDNRPNTQPPERIEGEKPKNATPHEKGQDRATRGLPRFWCIAPDGRIARVNKVTGKAPPRDTLRPCSGQVHATGKALGQW